MIATSKAIMAIMMISSTSEKPLLSGLILLVILLFIIVTFLGSWSEEETGTIATGCHLTGPLALRHRISPVLPISIKAIIASVT